MINAVFLNNVNEITIDGLTQWDKGRKLKITLSSLPANFEVHFANKNADIAYVVKGTASGGVATVLIPNIVLMKPADVVAWVYDSQSDDLGKTIATINLPLVKRTKPADYYYTESELEAVDYVRLEQRVTDLEDTVDGLKEGVDTDAVKEAVNEYLETHSIQTGATAEQAQQIEKNTQDISKLSGQKVDGTGIKSIVKKTQAEYDAMASHDANTLYVIVG